ncbi:hypothetical protein IG631_17053 [Alternaria alternata]|nr:hypothetical protein IG631_17053 [Alternaria alternata]
MQEAAHQVPRKEIKRAIYGKKYKFTLAEYLHISWCSLCTSNPTGFSGKLHENTLLYAILLECDGQPTSASPTA